MIDELHSELPAPVVMHQEESVEERADNRGMREAVICPMGAPTPQKAGENREVAGVVMSLCHSVQRLLWSQWMVIVIEEGVRCLLHCEKRRIESEGV